MPPSSERLLSGAPEAAAEEGDGLDLAVSRLDGHGAAAEHARQEPVLLEGGGPDDNLQRVAARPVGAANVQGAAVAVAGGVAAEDAGGAVDRRVLHPEGGAARAVAHLVVQEVAALHRDGGAPDGDGAALDGLAGDPVVAERHLVEADPRIRRDAERARRLVGAEAVPEDDPADVYVGAVPDLHERPRVPPVQDVVHAGHRGDGDALDVPDLQRLDRHDVRRKPDLVPRLQAVDGGLQCLGRGDGVHLGPC